MQSLGALHLAKTGGNDRKDLFGLLGWQISHGGCTEGVNYIIVN
jgi:hypothetical protein